MDDCYRAVRLVRLVYDEMRIGAKPLSSIEWGDMFVRDDDQKD